WARRSCLPRTHRRAAIPSSAWPRTDCRQRRRPGATWYHRVLFPAPWFLEADLDLPAQAGSYPPLSIDPIAGFGTLDSSRLPAGDPEAQSPETDPPAAARHWRASDRSARAAPRRTAPTAARRRAPSRNPDRRSTDRDRHTRA